MQEISKDLLRQISTSFSVHSIIYGNDRRFNSGLNGLAFILIIGILPLLWPLRYLKGLVNTTIKPGVNKLEIILSKNQNIISKNIEFKDSICINLSGLKIGEELLIFLPFLVKYPIKLFFILTQCLKIKKLRINDIRVLKMIALRYLIEEILIRHSGVKRIVQYNDHSPYNIFIFQWAKTKDLKMIYIQHAPVTSRFPKLYHDENYLFSEYNYLKYKKSKNLLFKRKVNVKIISDIRFWGIDNTTTGSEKLDILLCVNKIDSIRLIEELYSKLENEGLSVRIRKHPGDKRNFSSRIMLSKESDVWRDLNRTNCVICNESSIALQALYLSKKTLIYQLSKAQYRNDVYGFIQSGLIAEKIFNFQHLLREIKKNDVNHKYDISFFTGRLIEEKFHKEFLRNL